VHTCLEVNEYLVKAKLRVNPSRANLGLTRDVIPPEGGLGDRRTSGDFLTRGGHGEKHGLWDPFRKRVKGRGVRWLRQALGRGSWVVVWRGRGCGRGGGRRSWVWVVPRESWVVARGSWLVVVGRRWSTRSSLVARRSCVVGGGS